MESVQPRTVAIGYFWLIRTRPVASTPSVTFWATATSASTSVRERYWPYLALLGVETSSRAVGSADSSADFTVSRKVMGASADAREVFFHPVGAEWMECVLRADAAVAR